LVDALAIEECSHEEQQICEESVSTIPRWAQRKQTPALKRCSEGEKAGFDVVNWEQRYANRRIVVGEEVSDAMGRNGPTTDGEPTATEVSDVLFSIVSRRKDGFNGLARCQAASLVMV
jgi:hypothetical protein